MPAVMATRSSLELMLDMLRQKDEQPEDEPPALPLRPASKGRLPRAKRLLLGSPGDLDVVEKENVNNFEQVVVFTKELNCSNNEKENHTVDHAQKIMLEGVLGIQKRFRGKKARCYYHNLQKGVTTLQSFVRGENERKHYQVSARRMTAIIIIQKHVKRWIALKRSRNKAAILLQSVIRGWLTRKHVRPMVNVEDQCTKNEEMITETAKDTQDIVQIPSSVLEDLRSRVAMAEGKLEKKEEENAILLQRLIQSEKRWSQYESKMKAMEEMWQSELTSLQMSLGAAKKNVDDVGIAVDLPKPDTFLINRYQEFEDKNTVSVEKLSINGSITSRSFCPTPDFGTERRSSRGPYVVSHLEEEFEQQRKVFEDDNSSLIKVRLSQEGLAGTPDDELRKLKFRFEAWKKDYKVRLQETKTMLQKVGHSETERSRRTWWGKMSAHLGF